MRFLSNLKIGSRLSVAFAIVVALTVVSAAFGQAYLSDVRRLATEMTTAQAERSTLAFSWRQNIVANRSQSIVLGIVTDPEVYRIAKTNYQKTSDLTAKLKGRFEETETTAEGKALLARLAEIRTRYLALREIVSRPADSDGEGESPARVVAIKDFLKTGGDYEIAADDIVNYEQQRNKASGDNILAAVSVTSVASLVCAGVSAVASLILGFVLTRSIVRPLRGAQEAADRIARGDLTGEVAVVGNDEATQLSSALASMQEALRRIVREIRSSTESIQVASSQVATGNQDLSSRTEETAGSLQQAAASMEELTITMRNSADAAGVASGMATSASAIASKGGGVVAEVVTTMDEINASSRRIADIIGVIDGIAFQTNILALNAAVEAARAGEQGRGFAVVAGEVRTLAHRSAEAAKEIKTLIGASVEKVEAGARLVGDAGASMGEIVESVQRVSQVIFEIKNAATEQSVGIRQVNEAVSHVDQMTQQNAALVEESAAAAESMRAQATLLSKTVEQFSL